MFEEVELKIGNFNSWRKFIGKNWNCFIFLVFGCKCL